MKLLSEFFTPQNLLPKNVRPVCLYWIVSSVTKAKLLYLESRTQRDATHGPLHKQPFLWCWLANHPVFRLLLFSLNFHQSQFFGLFSNKWKRVFLYKKYHRMTFDSPNCSAHLSLISSRYLNSGLVYLCSLFLVYWGKYEGF